VQGKGWRIFWRTQDAKQTAPERATPVLIAEAQRGELINDDAIPAVRLIGVRAKLFRDGVHSANMTAGQIEANRKERRVVGTGGVTIRSLTNPPDTVIIADTLTWDTSADQIIAEGNATVRKPARRGALPFLAENVQRVRFDTRLEKFRIE
jgi:lipopolysaccharide assembly outer membrane protein LptD (OstA)